MAWFPGAEIAGFSLSTPVLAKAAGPHLPLKHTPSHGIIPVEGSTPGGCILPGSRVSSTPECGSAVPGALIQIKLFSVLRRYEV